jgi:hypothetical protein
VHERFLCAQSLRFTVLELNEDSMIVANLLSIGEKALVRLDYLVC